MTKALILSSGGLDSTVCLAKAVDQYGRANVATLSVSYGQRHSRELWSSEAVAVVFGVPHDELNIPPDLLASTESSLTSNLEMPTMTYKELQSSQGPSITYVPNRNAILISLVAARALIEGYDEVWIGTHAEDARNWAYPDCTPEFVGAMAAAVLIGTYNKVRLVTPLEWLTKAQVVALGQQLSVPFDLTWTCYEGGDVACGTCPSCVERLEAFKVNGLVDPISYKESK